ncbi:sensor domain-containing diguanylate cyclase [Marinobacter confluentis]|uniref:diguanylate cyclase n=1 Tax=Marinobacter confluentis TaxID=1697557 RepID=A0A4Z1C615_9GAMM|nr:diguanylate cyclase [Marinobacter confluentis]TGN41000.1 diguanylate cyclase [Marinobacter confluentis]
MSISTKTTLPIIFMAALLSLSAYFIQRNVVYPAFSEIELNYARDNIDRVVRRLEGELDTIDFTVYDWSSWDDTYSFMQDRNEAYIDSNLHPDTFWNYGIQIALFLDNSGDPFWAGIYDFNAEEGKTDLTDTHLDAVLPVANAFSRRIDLDADVDDQKAGGILQIGDLPVLFSMRPIYQSDGTGEPRGYVMFGQVLSEQRIETLSEQIVLDFQVEPVNRDNDSVASGAYRIEAVDDQTLRASKIMMIGGIPSLKTSVTLPRHITQLGSEITVYGISLFVLLTLFMSITLLLLFRVLVIRPVMDLKQDISKISSAMDYSLRAQIRNEDEIGALSQEFNSLLGIIESNNTELKKLTETDPLTGLFNRLAMDKRLRSAWNLLMRTGDPIAVMLIDIDHFKEYNDHYGHPAGDECLKSMAGILNKAAKRETDMVARFGGEEFLVMLPGTGTDAALEIAAELKEAVANANIEHARSSAAPHVSISIGVAAVIPSHHHIPSDLIQAADDALYQAKASGRNKALPATLDP